MQRSLAVGAEHLPPSHGGAPLVGWGGGVVLPGFALFLPKTCRRLGSVLGMGVMEKRGVSLPQFPHAGSCCSPRARPASTGFTVGPTVNKASSQGCPLLPQFPHRGDRGAVGGFPEGGGGSPKIHSLKTWGCHQGCPHTAPTRRGGTRLLHPPNHSDPSSHPPQGFPGRALCSPTHDTSVSVLSPPAARGTGGAPSCPPHPSHPTGAGGGWR